MQFTFAIVLIICTIIVQRQLQYARDRDTGYNKGNLVYVFSQGDMLKNYDLIKNELLNSKAAVAVSKLFSPITRVWGQTSGLSWQGSTEQDKKMLFTLFGADADFAKTTGAKVIQGRDLDLNNYPTDSAAVLLNEAAVKAMNIRNPVGKTIRDAQGANINIIGVVKDFIIESPYEEVQPMVIRGLPKNAGGQVVIHFKLNPANQTADNLAKA